MLDNPTIGQPVTYALRYSHVNNNGGNGGGTDVSYEIIFATEFKK